MNLFTVTIMLHHLWYFFESNDGNSGFFWCKRIARVTSHLDSDKISKRREVERMSKRNTLQLKIVVCKQSAEVTIERCH